MTTPPFIRKAWSFGRRKLHPERWLVLGLSVLRRMQTPGSSLSLSPKILIIRLDQLGDVVMTLPLIQALKERFPESSCTLLVQEAWAPLFHGDQLLDRVVVRTSKKPMWLPGSFHPLWSAWRTYKQKLSVTGYDVVISPRFDTDQHQATFIALLNRATVYLGYKSQWQIMCPFTQGFDMAGVRHEVLRGLDLLEPLGIPVRYPVLDLHIGLNAQRHRLAISEEPLKLVVALGLGSSVKSGKRWPVSYFSTCLHILERHVPIAPIIVCSLAELDLAKEFESAFGSEVPIFSDYDIESAAELLRRSDLYIGNDSGGAHLAAAVGVPVVVVSAHTSSSGMGGLLSPHRFRPWSDRVLVAMPRVPLSPCVNSCIASEAHCILQNTPEAVAILALELLRETNDINEAVSSHEMG